MIVKSVLTFTIIFIPTALFGILLPIVSAVFSYSINRRGGGIGDTFSLNVTGSIIGSILTGFILIPYLGVNTSMVLLGIINIIAGLILFSGRTKRVLCNV